MNPIVYDMSSITGTDAFTTPEQAHRIAQGILRNMDELNAHTALIDWDKVEQGPTHTFLREFINDVQAPDLDRPRNILISATTPPTCHVLKDVALEVGIEPAPPQLSPADRFSKN